MSAARGKTQDRVTHYWHYHDRQYVEGIALMWAVPQGSSLADNTLRHIALKAAFDA